ncbi:MAG: methyltransferase domain-containing protein, partial [Chloroflexi bacterium]|nr:methyltransferase domain-containing protein [Chloroflexota bacterium]
MRLVSRGYRHPGGPGHAASELLELRGQRCLDVGCGIGDDARAIAKAFDVHVVGIDQNPPDDRGCAVTFGGFFSGDVSDSRSFGLPCPNEAFDGGWLKRTLMHIANPAVVIGEIMRVVKPGGRVVAVEPELEVVLIDSGVVDVTRKVLAMHAGAYSNAWDVRQLRRLLTQAGLTEVHAAPKDMTTP